LQQEDILLYHFLLCSKLKKIAFEAVHLPVQVLFIVNIANNSNWHSYCRT